MSKKQKKTTKKIESLSPSQGEANNQEKKSPKTTGGKIFLIFYNLIFAALIISFIWGGYSAIITGTFSNLFIVGLALGSFLISILFKILQKTGYGRIYRFLSILCFSLICLLYITSSRSVFVSNLDGMPFALICVTAIAAFICANIPFLTGKLSPKALTNLSLGILGALVIFIFAISSIFLTPRQKIAAFYDIYPFQTASRKNSDDLWFFGDNRFLLGKKDKFTTFTILKAKPEEKSKPISSPPLYEKKSQNFSWSLCKNRPVIALAALEDEKGENHLLTIDLAKGKTFEFHGKSAENFNFPWKSCVYPQYSTWNPDGEKFFFFSQSKENGMEIHVANPSGGEILKMDLPQILSAFWNEKGDLIIIAGEKTASEIKKADTLENFGTDIFDFTPQKGTIYRWNPSLKSPQKIADLPKNAKLIKIHPASGKLFAFTGENLLIFGGEKPETIKFTFLPHPQSSEISPDGAKILLSVKTPDNKSNLVKLIDLADSREKNILTTKDEIKHITFSQKGRFIMFSSTTKPSPIIFNSKLNIYDGEKDRLYGIVPNMSTGFYRAALKDPLAYPININGEIYFETLDFNKILFSKENEISIWKILIP